MVGALSLALLVAAASPASSAKKTSHRLSVAFFYRVLDSCGATDNVLCGEGTIRGRPFGKRTAELEVVSTETLVPNPNGGVREDWSGTGHATFTVTFTRHRHVKGRIRGHYDYTLDTEANPSSNEPGVITGGSGVFKGAKGKFVIPNRPLLPGSERPTYQGHWEGSIRY
jgi:hypothetical protein